MQSASRPCLTSHSYWRETLRRLLITTLTKRTNTRERGQISQLRNTIEHSTSTLDASTFNWRYRKWLLSEYVRPRDCCWKSSFCSSISWTYFFFSLSLLTSFQSLSRSFPVRHLSNVCQRSIYFFSSQERTS